MLNRDHVFLFLHLQTSDESSVGYETRVLGKINIAKGPKMSFTVLSFKPQSSKVLGTDAALF